MIRIDKLFASAVAILLVAATLAPFSGIAFADGGKPEVSLKVAPGSNGETSFIITVKDDNHQPVLNGSVSLTAEQIAQPSAGHLGMPGMQHSGPKFNGQAKPGAQPGEYVVNVRLPSDGDWMITVASPKGKGEFTVNANKGNVQVTAGNPPATSGPTAQGPVAPMEAVHASYLDLSVNIADLRSRVDLWQKGDESSLNIAKEKADRTQVVLGSIVWPAEMNAAIAKTRTAMEPMAKALNASNASAAQAAVKDLGDGSHDVTHAFYGDWLPTLKDARFSQMAPHAIFLDLNGNIADLQSRVDAWQKGDESSLNIAKEKVDRIGLLLPHMSSTAVLLKPTKAVEKGLPAVAAALEKKDAAAAQTALKPIAAASGDLSRDFYSWLNVTAGASDATCVQASYLALSANITDLRAGVDLWQKGDESSLKIAHEKLGRAQVILDHMEWPAAMSAAIGKTKAALDATAKGLNAKDVAAVQAVAKDLSDGSHDVTHAYYGDWLPSANLSSAANQLGGSQGSGTAPLSADHHMSTLSSYWFVGSMVGIVLITIVLVPILRRRDLASGSPGVSGA